MTRKAIIERTIKTLSRLQDDKVAEISDFADFVSKRYEEYPLNKGFRQVIGDVNRMI